jgi:hypothetical protein
MVNNSTNIKTQPLAPQTFDTNVHVPCHIYMPAQHTAGLTDETDQSPLIQGPLTTIQI